MDVTADLFVATFFLDVDIAFRADQSCVFFCITLHSLKSVEHRILFRKFFPAIRTFVFLNSPLYLFQNTAIRGVISLVVGQRFKQLATCMVPREC